MKKLVLLAITSLFMYSCGESNEDKARKLIEEKLQTTMNDWSSYEFVEMTPLDSVFTKFEDSEYMKEHRRKMLTAMNNTGNIKSKLKSCKKSEESILQDSLAYYKNIEDSLMNVFNSKKESFKGDFIGYETKFSFRGNNKLGAKVLSNINVVFDKEISTIKDIIENK